MNRTQEIQLTKENKNKVLLKVFNCFTNLSNSELDIVNNMLDNNILILNKTNRALIRTNLNTSVYNFNNYVKKLKDRNYLIKTKQGDLKLHPNVSHLNLLTSLNLKFVIV